MTLTTLEGAATLLAAEGLPTDDLSTIEPGDWLWLGESDQPNAVIALQRLSAPIGLLRSLAVRDSERGRGFGVAMVERLENHASTSGVRELYLLTETAEAFFLRRGYDVIERERVPPVVRSCREFSELCPASAVVMVKVLASSPAA